MTALRWLGFFLSSCFLENTTTYAYFYYFSSADVLRGLFSLALKYFCHLEIPALHWRLPRNSSQRLTSAIIWPRESLFKVHCSQTILYPRDSFDPLDVIPFGNLTHLGYITLNIEDSVCHFNIHCQSTMKLW